MKNKLTSNVILTAVALVCAASLVAQNAEKKDAPAPQKKKASPLPGAGTGGNTPHATISGVIGPNRNEGSMITISYGRPNAVHPRKQDAGPRKIWGGLVPWDKADRLGADEATTLLNEHPIEIGGKTLPSGAYVLYIVPSETGTSKLAFSKHISKWGIPVDEKADVVRVDLKRDTLDTNVDQLTLEIENTPPGSMNGRLKIKWEKTQFSAPFTVKK